MKFPTNKALEGAIRADKSDAAACAVYADWLQAQGSPAGELMALAGKTEQDSSDRFAVLAKELGLPEKNLATWQWRFGLWEWLHLENSKDWMDESFDPVALAKQLFALPFCTGLDELRIGVLRWEHNQTDVPAVLDEASAHDWAKTLPSLHLGDITTDIDMAHHVVGEVGGVITLSFPKLVSLKVHSGAQDWRDGGETFSLAGLALPKLERLVVETCGMTSARLEGILRAKLPALTHLELWFGDSNRDAGATVDDLAPLLDGTAFPGVTHLGLRNLDFGGALAERLATSKLGPRLASLDLSMSTFDDSHVAVLADLAGALPNVGAIDVDDNFLSDEALATLGDRFTSGAQKDGEEAYRYVTVGE